MKLLKKRWISFFVVLFSLPLLSQMNLGGGQGGTKTYNITNNPDNISLQVNGSSELEIKNSFVDTLTAMTFWVAPADAPARLKADAQWVLTGNSGSRTDGTSLENLIDALPSTGRALIVILTGNIYAEAHGTENAQWTIDRDSTWIVNHAHWTHPNADNGYTIKFVDVVAGGWSGGSFDGNGPNQTTLNRCFSMPRSSHITIENVHVYNFRSMAIETRGAHDWIVRNNTLDSSITDAGRGLHVSWELQNRDGGTPATTDDEPYNGAIINNYISDQGATCVAVINGWNILIANNFLEANENAVMSSSGDNVFTFALDYTDSDTLANIYFINNFCWGGREWEIKGAGWGATTNSAGGGLGEIHIIDNLFYWSRGTIDKRDSVAYGPDTPFGIIHEGNTYVTKKAPNGDNRHFWVGDSIPKWTYIYMTDDKFLGEGANVTMIEFEDAATNRGAIPRLSDLKFYEGHGVAIKLGSGHLGGGYVRECEIKMDVTSNAYAINIATDSTLVDNNLILNADVGIQNRGDWNTIKDNVLLAANGVSNDSGIVVFSGSVNGWYTGNIFRGGWSQELVEDGTAALTSTVGKAWLNFGELSKTSNFIDFEFGNTSTQDSRVAFNDTLEGANGRWELYRNVDAATFKALQGRLDFFSVDEIRFTPGDNASTPYGEISYNTTDALIEIAANTNDKLRIGADNKRITDIVLQRHSTNPTSLTWSFFIKDGTPDTLMHTTGASTYSQWPAWRDGFGFHGDTLEVGEDNFEVVEQGTGADLKSAGNVNIKASGDNNDFYQFSASGDTAVIANSGLGAVVIHEDDHLIPKRKETDSGSQTLGIQANPWSFLYLKMTWTEAEFDSDKQEGKTGWIDHNTDGTGDSLWTYINATTRYNHTSGNKETP